MTFEEKLIQKYPELFYKNEDGVRYCPCGAYVPSGWEPIVEELCGAIHDYLTKTYRFKDGEKVYPPSVRIDQIKEKFGGLRFYFSGGDEKVAGMVHFTEYLCNKVCEVSGEKGELCIRGGWYKTLSENTRNTDPYKGYEPVK